jgi:septum site-determining protein MinC
MSETVSIKGTREGLTVAFGEGDLATILEQLAQHLAAQGAFFRGGTVALQVGERVLSAPDLQRVSELFAQHDMILRTVFTSQPLTEQAAMSLGLRLLQAPSPTDSAPSASSPRPAASAIEQPAVRALEGTRGIMIRHRVRSGQVVRHTGHVVVIGDVNVGAVISAGGDIVIWGKLSGTVHAGNTGDSQAIVCALEFSPMQLRIAEHIALADESAAAQTTCPEMAFVQGNAIVVEPWDRALRGA